ncbi:MAG: M23 family metallopeptidase [Nitrospira sp.]
MSQPHRDRRAFEMAEKEKSADAYTIVIFRGAKSAPLRYSFSGPAVKRLKILALVLLIVQGVFMAHYVIQSSQVLELTVLREDVVSMREQTSSFSNSLEELKRRLLAMQEVNQRLKIMLGIEEQKQGDMVSGKGGSEQPVVGGEPLQGARPVIGQAPAPVPAGAPPSGDLLTVNKVQEDISWLERQSKVEEQVLDALIEAAKDKAGRWAAMPSIWPVHGWITSGFGPRVSPFTGLLAMHDGLDIGAAPNTSVQAPASGYVVSAGFEAKMGNVIQVDHGYGIETEYGHLAKILVKKGQKVKRGDVIALVGSTGRSTGPHLHYMVKIKGQSVNPRDYILD